MSEFIHPTDAEVSPQPTGLPEENPETVKTTKTPDQRYEDGKSIGRVQGVLIGTVTIGLFGLFNILGDAVWDGAQTACAHAYQATTSLDTIDLYTGPDVPALYVPQDYPKYDTLTLDEKASALQVIDMMNTSAEHASKRLTDEREQLRDLGHDAVLSTFLFPDDVSESDIHGKVKLSHRCEDLIEAIRHHDFLAKLFAGINFVREGGPVLDIEN